MKWLKEPPGEFVFSPWAVEKKLLTEWFEAYRGSYTKKNKAYLMKYQEGIIHINAKSFKLE